MDAAGRSQHRLPISRRDGQMDTKRVPTLYTARSGCIFFQFIFSLPLLYMYYLVIVFTTLAQGENQMFAGLQYNIIIVIADITAFFCSYLCTNNKI